MKIGLYGPYGFGNLGDAAIQQAMIQHIKKFYPNAQIYGISLNPEDTQRRHGIQSFPINRKFPKASPENIQKKTLVTLAEKIPYRFRSNSLTKLFKRIFFRIPHEILFVIRIYEFLRGFDLLIISGGGQLDDSWGGPWNHPFSLYKWAVISKIRRVKFIVVSVGAGPTETALGKFFIRRTLQLSSYHSYRDVKSKSRIENLGVTERNYVYPDLAYSIQIPQDKFHNIAKVQPAVGISPIAYCDPRVWPKRDQAIYTCYLNKLTSFISWLLQMNYKVVFCPSQINHERPVIEEIIKKLKEAQILNFSTQIINFPIKTVEDLLAQISETDIVIGSRYHSVLLSHLMNKPVIALSYDEKVDSLMEGMGQKEFCLPIEQYEVDTLIEKFLKLYGNSKDIKVALERKAQEYRSALDEQYIRIFNIPGYHSEKRL